MILGLILATSLFLISVGSHLVILNAGHTLLEQNCSLLHKLGIALLVLFSHLTVAAFSPPASGSARSWVWAASGRPAR